MILLIENRDAKTPSVRELSGPSITIMYAIADPHRRALAIMVAPSCCLMIPITAADAE